MRTVMPDKMLDGRVAFVTGGGSGIGAAAGKLLAREGAKVVLISRTKEELEAVVDDIKGAGGEASALEADVNRAIGTIEKLATVLGPVTRIRMEQLL